MRDKLPLGGSVTELAARSMATDRLYARGGLLARVPDDGIGLTTSLATRNPRQGQRSLLFDRAPPYNSRKRMSRESATRARQVVLLAARLDNHVFCLEGGVINQKGESPALRARGYYHDLSRYY